MTTETPGVAPAVAEKEPTQGELEVKETQGAEAGTGNEGDATPEPKVVKPDGRTKRIHELTAKFRREERERLRLAAENEALRKQVNPVVDTEPTLEQFDFDHGRYTAALVARQLEKERAEARKQEATQKEQTAAQERLNKFLERDAEFAASTPDYVGADELANDPTFVISQVMTEVIAESDIGPALLHYLDQHRDESSKIASLSPHVAAAALGRIEARLEKTEPVKPKVETPVAKPSKAPPPPPQAKATAPAVRDLSDASVPVGDWMKLREQQVSRKRT